MKKMEIRTKAEAVPCRSRCRTEPGEDSPTSWLLARRPCPGTDTGNNRTTLGTEGGGGEEHDTTIHLLRPKTNFLCVCDWVFFVFKLPSPTHPPILLKQSPPVPKGGWPGVPAGVPGSVPFAQRNPRSGTAPPLPSGSCRLLLADRQTSESTPFGRCLKGIVCAGTRLTALHSLPGPPRSRPCPSGSRTCCPPRSDTAAPPPSAPGVWWVSGGDSQNLETSGTRPEIPGGHRNGRCGCRVHRTKEGGREAAPLSSIDGTSAPGPLAL